MGPDLLLVGLAQLRGWEGVCRAKQAGLEKGKGYLCGECLATIDL